MFSLQQFEEAEDRIHAWHGEMRRCMDEQRAQARSERRSWLAALGHCLGYIGGWHFRSRESDDEMHTGINQHTVRSTR